jgi:phosphoribosylaminoimidazole carboxylase (NCAIR synthetase)
MMSGAGRKMGHITVLGNSVEAAQSIAECAAKEIYFG